MIPNLIGQRWVCPERDTLPVYNPATGEVIEQVPLSGPREIDRAVQAAASAFENWSQTPVTERVQKMFRFKNLLEKHFEELAQIITRHHGKTLEERTLRQVSQGVDQDYYRYPLGVVAGITPFNFPVMIPLWMFPLAVIAGDPFFLKH